MWVCMCMKISVCMCNIDEYIKLVAITLVHFHVVLVRLWDLQKNQHAVLPTCMHEASMCACKHHKSKTYNNVTHMYVCTAICMYVLPESCAWHFCLLGLWLCTHVSIATHLFPVWHVCIDRCMQIVRLPYILVRVAFLKRCQTRLKYGWCFVFAETKHTKHTPLNTH